MEIISRSRSPSHGTANTDLNTPLANRNADDVDENSGEAWEEYDPTKFGPDCTVASAASTSTGPGTISGQQECSTPLLPVDQ